MILSTPDSRVYAPIPAILRPTPPTPASPRARAWGRILAHITVMRPVGPLASTIGDDAAKLARAALAG